MKSSNYQGIKIVLQIVALIFWLSSSSQGIPVKQVVSFFIAINGNDQNTGTIVAPLATLEKAKQTVRTYLQQHQKFQGQIIVYLRQGTYYIEKPVEFTEEDSGNENCQIIYTAYQDEAVTVSGGQRVLGQWQKQPGVQFEGTPDERAIWKMHIASAEKGQWYFRQLFADNKRLQRATTGVLYTNGPLPQFRDSIKPHDFTTAGRLKENNLAAWCGFQFQNNDIQMWTDLASAEIITYHSWECSWQRVHHVDALTHSVILKSPSRYPVGFFSNHTRYRIENIKAALDNYGEWYLDTDQGDLYYYAYPNEDPNQIEFIIPKQEKLLLFTGQQPPKTVSFLSFKNLKFSYADYTLNKTSLSKEAQIKAEKQYPWLDIASGYTDAQAAPEAGSAITMFNAANCSFENCEFSHLGAYAVHIGAYSHQNQVLNCTFFDTGGGGIMIGFNERLPLSQNLPLSSSPASNRIHNNFIYNGGLIHPSAVAVLIMQANNTVISHNEIYNYPYTGVSCGWTWGSGLNFTKANIIEYNHIHHVMNELADGGGIYTLGNQPGAIIRNNFIHDIYRKPDAIGSFNNGIFFDEGSEGILVSSNVVRDIQNQSIRFNRSASNKFTWKENFFEANKKMEKKINSIIIKAGHLYQ